MVNELPGPPASAGAGPIAVPVEVKYSMRAVISDGVLFFKKTTLATPDAGGKPAPGSCGAKSTNHGMANELATPTPVISVIATATIANFFMLNSPPLVLAFCIYWV
jgi:hypothetical protein